jgi:hypothetical protein
MGEMSMAYPSLSNHQPARIKAFDAQFLNALMGDRESRPARKRPKSDASPIAAHLKTECPPRQESSSLPRYLFDEREWVREFGY